MPAFFAYFFAPFRFAPILRQFTRREILGRYRGSTLGITWAFISPLSMLAVYTFVFVEIFKARWPGATELGGFAFSQRIFAGLMVFNLFSEMVSRAPTLVLEQPNLVKKVFFPLEVLPFIMMGSALFHFFLSATILVASTLVFNQGLSFYFLLLPIVILPLLPLLLGMSWLLAALGVYLRDIGQIVTLLVGLLMFLSPVFYSVQSLSPRWQQWLNLNPLTLVIENLRTVTFSAVAPNWVHWWTGLGVGCAVAVVGAWTFSKTRDGFADVI